MFGSNAFGWPYFGQGYAGATSSPTTVNPPSGFITVSAGAPTLAITASPPSGKVTLAAGIPFTNQGGSGGTTVVTVTETSQVGGRGGLMQPPIRPTVSADDELVVALLAASRASRSKIRVTTGQNSGRQ